MRFLCLLLFFVSVSETALNSNIVEIVVQTLDLIIDLYQSLSLQNLIMKTLSDYLLILSYLSAFRLYNGNTVGQQFGPKCCRGDRIGCGISLDSDDGQLTVFFTKNGKEVSALWVEVDAALDSCVCSLGGKWSIDFAAKGIK